MTTKEQLETAKELLQYLHSYNSNTKQIMPIEDRVRLKELYISLFRVILNIGCESCILHGLNMLQAWYERESQTAPYEPELVVFSEEIELQESEPKPCNKCGKSKSK